MYENKSLIWVIFSANPAGISRPNFMHSNSSCWISIEIFIKSFMKGRRIGPVNTPEAIAGKTVPASSIQHSTRLSGRTEAGLKLSDWLTRSPDSPAKRQANELIRTPQDCVPLRPSLFQFLIFRFFSFLVPFGFFLFLFLTFSFFFSIFLNIHSRLANGNVARFWMRLTFKFVPAWSISKEFSNYVG